MTRSRRRRSLPADGRAIAEALYGRTDPDGLTPAEAAAKEATDRWRRWRLAEEGASQEALERLRPEARRWIVGEPGECQGCGDRVPLTHEVRGVGPCGACCREHNPEARPFAGARNCPKCSRGRARTVPPVPFLGRRRDPLPPTIRRQRIGRIG